MKPAESINRMESGTLKWFDEAKGYGCIRRENGEEIHVPISAIHASGFRKLKPGEAVQFDTGAGLSHGLDEGKAVNALRKLAEDGSVVLGGFPGRDMQTKIAPQSVIHQMSYGNVLPDDSGRERLGLGPEDRVLLRSIRKSLGIRDALKSDADLVAIVEERLPVAAISALLEHGILEKEIYSVIVPRRTLQHRRARKEKLSREESDRAVRLARLAALNEKAFGDREAGLHWLRSPKKRFHGRTPMAMIETEAGSRLVEEALYQIDEGMAA